MSKDETKSPPVDSFPDEWADADSKLGHALVLLNRLIPRLDDLASATDVQAGFRHALACLEAARQAHQRVVDSRQIVMNIAAQTNVEPETVAVIAAAIAAVLDQPYRLLAVQPVPSPAPHLNVWALEGRTQIFQSHKIR
jgi:hypothetical protein